MKTEKHDANILSNDLKNQGSLDLLIISPSLDWMTENARRISMRIEKTIPNQESPYLNVAYLTASVKQAGFNAKFIDMVTDQYSVEKLVRFCVERKPALIGFTAFTQQICAAGTIAKAIKQEMPEAVICAGGPHVYAMHMETLEQFPAFDFVVRGEAEEILPKILEEPKNLKAISKLPGVITRGKQDLSWAFINDVDALPFPNWEDYDLTKYAGLGPHGTKLEIPMITGRGCPFKCTFCCRANGNVSRRRSVQSVINEIEYLLTLGCEAIYFLDENFILANQWTEEFFNEMIGRGLNDKLRWACAMRVSLAKPKLMQRMAEAGCYNVFFGFESANHDTLKRIKKTIRPQQMLDAVLATKQAGIIPTGAFIVGLPGDTKKEIYEAIELGKKLYLWSITFPIAVPYPGTEMRDQAEKNMWGMKILHNNWELYGKKEKDSSESFTILESDDFTGMERLEMQKIAYSEHPKKGLKDYIENHLNQFRVNNKPFPNEKRLIMS